MMRRATAGVSVVLPQRPGDVIERDKLGDEHAVVRSLGDREVKGAAQARVLVAGMDRLFGISEQALEAGVILGGCVLGG